MGSVSRIPAWMPRGRPSDTAVTAVVGVFVVVFTIVDMVPMDDTDLLGLVPVVGACAALFARREHPVAVLLLTLSANAVYYPFVVTDGPLFVTFAVALYSAAARGHLVVGTIVGAGFATAVGVSEYRSGENHLADGALFLLYGWIVAVIAIGGMLHNRNAFLAEARRRAAEAEHTLEEEARRRAVEERLRIARELHATCSAIICR